MNSRPADSWDTIATWLERWQTADETERVRLRAQLIRDHSDLAAEALALAAASDRLSDFLETPALVIAAESMSPADTVFASGTRIGPYDVVALLARGGMGDVYRAYDSRLGRQVAVKVLSDTRTSDPRLVARFINEARITASLDHPNIVRVHDIGSADGHTYLVAELLEGETLRSRIERGRLAPEDVVRIGIDIARGLSAAHQAGLVHRDLKPENIFLTRSGETKILDFGIAKLAQDEGVRDGFSTLTGVVMGTAAYLSPEQIRGGAIDYRADLFALGAVLFEMITGQRAFARPHLVDVLHAIVYDDVPDGGVKIPRVPFPLGDIVSRLLEKSPGARFQSAGDVIAALEQIGKQSAIHRWNARVRSTARTWRRAKLTGARQTLVASVLIAAALTSAGLFWWSKASASAGDTQPVTLAVMPFRSIPADAEGTLLELGLADVLVSRLSQLTRLRVLPVTATERLKGMDAAEAARQLGATHALSVTLQRDGGQVRAVPQLMAATGEPIWTTTIDTERNSTFAIQDIIVTKVIDELAPKLSGGLRTKLARSGTRNSDAFDAYARGRAYVLQPTRADLLRAKEAFEAALQLDPSYAEAWAGLGSAYKRMPIGAGVAGSDAFPKAKAAALRALELDPDNAEAHSVLGTVAFWYDWDYALAERELRLALDLQPSSADSLLFLAHLHANTGRSDEALAEIRAARAFDPEWLLARAQEGHFLLMARRYDEALTSLDATVRMAPRFWPAHQMRLILLAALSRWDDAIRQVETRSALADQTGNDSSLGVKGYILARQGRLAEAEETLTQLRRRTNGRHGTSDALVLHALGRDREAMASLQEVIDARDHTATFLGVYPSWDDLRDDPAFRHILKQVNLLEVSDRTRTKSARQ